MQFLSSVSVSMNLPIDAHKARHAAGKRIANARKRIAKACKTSEDQASIEIKPSTPDFNDPEALSKFLFSGEVH